MAGIIGLASVPASAEWVATWTAPPHAPLGTEGPFAAASYDNVTLSQILRVSEGGEQPARALFESLWPWPAGHRRRAPGAHRRRGQGDRRHLAHAHLRR